MDELFNVFSAKYARIGTQFVRGIEREIEWNAPLVGIQGARGVGKTTLLLQHIKLHHKLDGSTLYASVDNIWFNAHSIYELATSFAQRGGHYLFLDEVHKYANWSQELKNIYDDLPELHVVFTGSSLLEILNARADLSRRAVVYEMQGFSFREYLNWNESLTLPRVSLEQATTDHVAIAMETLGKVKVLQHFDAYLRHGYYPFYKEFPSLFNSRLSEVVNMVLEIEIPQLRDVETSYIPKIKQLLYIIAESAPFVPNISKLSERIGLSRNALLQYINALHDSRITFSLQKESSGIARLQKPDKLYLDNTNLAYALIGLQPNAGTLRETFFANQLRYQHQVSMAEQGDFLVDHRYTFEVGGQNKGNKQIANIENAFIVADNIEYGNGNHIPLWIFGMLY
ncbi:MAG: ATP-binding protein [Bacteroidales bacterium]|nr:ATP-binding protein [Bacteroidales bacterium]